jgi:hypothetical protein
MRAPKSALNLQPRRVRHETKTPTDHPGKLMATEFICDIVKLTLYVVCTYLALSVYTRVELGAAAVPIALRSATAGRCMD